MALDATVMGSSSNSYATVAQANAYFADRLGAAAWNSIGDEIIDISSATISGTYYSEDNQTIITIAGLVDLTPALAVGESIQVATDLPAVDGLHFIKRIPASGTVEFHVDGDQSLISALNYMDRSGSGDKASALIMATRYLDQMMYLGERTTTSQKLSFPRMFLPDPDSANIYWGQAMRLRTDYLDQNTIPDRILYATYELAFRLLSNPELFSDPSTRQFKKVSIDGVLSVDFNENAVPRIIDRNIINYISPLLQTGSTVAVALKR